MRAILVVTLLLAAAGCTTMVLFPLRTTPIIHDDNFETVAQIIGPEQRWGEALDRSSLRTFVDKKTGAAAHQVYVSTTHQRGWRHFNRATDETATALEFLSIAQNVGSCAGAGGCVLTEVFGATVQDADLRRHAMTGFPIKFSAQTGAEVIVITPAELIQEQIRLVDEYLRSNGLPIPTPSGR